MSQWPQPTRKDHTTFCVTDGWQIVRDARGGTGTHHVIYELALPDGRILRTRISHPPGRQTYGPSLWAHILRDQLVVSEAEFWACVQDGVRPPRGMPDRPADTLPAEVAHLLLTRVGLTEAQIAALTRDEALARLHRYWTQRG